MPNGGELFVRLYCDEDVSVVAAAIVRARRFDVIGLLNTITSDEMIDQVRFI
mgnify:CR=1 FL=1